jgi:hypothetical protein
VVSNWQKIGCIEAIEGNAGAVGVFNGSFVSVILDGTWCGSCDSKEVFEAKHCQPLHEIEECADGSVIVRSVEKVEGKTARCALVVRSEEFAKGWSVETFTTREYFASKDKAIAAAVAYVSAR